VICWCDSLTNLQRTFDRNAIKEFELRVLFRMSSSDSRTLVDSPLASKLGPQRALFIHEETGTLEKFRPYAFPSAEWLDGVATAINARPAGTPLARPALATGGRTTKAEPEATDGFDLQGGFGDFNFAKMLDDIPGSDASSEPPAG
jgi:hypothetical protein